MACRFLFSATLAAAKPESIKIKNTKVRGFYNSKWFLLRFLYTFAA